MKHVFMAMSKTECDWLIKLLNKQPDTKIKSSVLNALLDALERDRRIRDKIKEQKKQKEAKDVR